MGDVLRVGLRPTAQLVNTGLQPAKKKNWTPSTQHYYTIVIHALCFAVRVLTVDKSLSLLIRSVEVGDVLRVGPPPTLQLVKAGTSRAVACMLVASGWFWATGMA